LRYTAGRAEIATSAFSKPPPSVTARAEVFEALDAYERCVAVSQVQATCAAEFADVDLASRINRRAEHRAACR